MNEILATISIGFFIMMGVTLVANLVYGLYYAIKHLTRKEMLEIVITIAMIVIFIGLCYLVGSFV